MRAWPSREDVAEAIRHALDMPLSERIARWKALYNGICRDDLDHWKTSFLADLATAAGIEQVERLREDDRRTGTLGPRFVAEDQTASA